MQPYDRIWIDVHLMTVAGGSGPFGVVERGALAVVDGRVAWLGKEADLPDAPDALASDVRAGEGAWLGAGLIDCHTHLVFGGDRADEFERRLGGESYESIARAGGGIQRTVELTRAASDSELAASASERVGGLLLEGVTTIEVKSGYGLDVETERKMLRVARDLAAKTPATIRTTFLGAHALPPEFEDRRAEYLEMVTREALPALVEDGLVDQADAFLESIAFTADECRAVLMAARALGLDVRLHADQLSDGGGALVAAEIGAVSADHLEYVSQAGVRAMARAGVRAVLLPGAYYTVGADRPPPIGAFREQGVAMAVATDLNPGSSPLRSLLLAMNMACTQFGMTPAETLGGVTRVAAAVLGLPDRGRLEVGLRADLALWRVQHPRELSYWIGGSPCVETVVAGEPVFNAREGAARAAHRTGRGPRR